VSVRILAEETFVYSLCFLDIVKFVIFSITSRPYWTQYDRLLTW